MHNGIIENYLDLKNFLKKKKYTFSSDTDSEVISHLINWSFKKSNNMDSALIETTNLLEGSYAIGIICSDDQGTVYAACKGSPLIIGKGVNQNYIASDLAPIISDTDKYITLDDNEFAKISSTKVTIFNKSKRIQNKVTKISNIIKISIFFIRPQALICIKKFMNNDSIIKDMTNRFVGKYKILPNIFGHGTDKVLETIEHIHFIACGTSYHASLVAKDWIEQHTTITCTAEVASEYKYKKINVLPNTLFVAISQSGETADTISSLKKALKLNYSDTLAICNVAESTLTRLSNLNFLMNAGPEISVASTKAFTSQLFASTSFNYDCFKKI